MTRITIDLPEDVLRKLESRAKEAGAANVSDYAANRLREDVEWDKEIDYGAPESVKIRTAADLERIVRDRSDDESGDIEADEKFFDDLEKYAREADAREAAARSRK
jgi:metal-responsive CopG/Arc/MetJ family transcriptional regulator